MANADDSLKLIRAALGGVAGAAFDMVALNAGATIYAADLTDSLASGVERAREVLRGGGGLKKLEQLAKFTSALAGE